MVWGMGYANLSGWAAIRLFLIWRRPTPWAPDVENIRTEIKNKKQDNLIYREAPKFCVCKQAV